MQTVGIAGIGTIGSGMCKNLLKHKFPLFVYNKTHAKAEAIPGAHVVNTPVELCQADIIITCVSNDVALRDVLFSEHGIFSALTPKQILIDCTTTSVPLTQEIADRCKAKNIAFLDAPTTGSKSGAESGTMLLMYGGDQAVFEQCRHIFEAIGKKFVHCGPNTYGQRMKIALNVAQGMVLEGYLEGVALAVKEGVPLQAITDVLDNSGAKNVAASVKLPSILQRDFTPHFLLELMHKDAKLAQQELGRLHIDLPLAKGFIKVCQEAMDAGLGKEDWSAIVKVLEKKAGVEITSSE